MYWICTEYLAQIWYWVLGNDTEHLVLDTIDTWYWEGREGVKRPGPGEGVSPVSWSAIIMVNMK